MTEAGAGESSGRHHRDHEPDGSTGSRPCTKFPVEFITIGGQKCGTTVMHRMLATHPELWLSETKELHFFDNDANFPASNVNLHAYAKHFATAPVGTKCGESTPSYLWWESAARRIQLANPKIKLIALLRNPVARAYSHWRMTTRRGEESLPFGEAIRAETLRLANGSDRDRRLFSYIDRGRYAPQLRRYFEHFPKNQLHVIRFDDLLDNPQQCFDKTCDFLEIKRQALLRRFTKSRPLSTDRPSPGERNWLLDVLAPEIADVEALLGWDCRNWFH